ncbi:hypothetical protein P7K49_040602, partial [Saguinus oedipus]
MRPDLAVHFHLVLLAGSSDAAGLPCLAWAAPLRGGGELVSVSTLRELAPLGPLSSMGLLPPFSVVRFAFRSHGGVKTVEGVAAGERGETLIASLWLSLSSSVGGSMRGAMWVVGCHVPWVKVSSDLREVSWVVVRLQRAASSLLTESRGICRSTRWGRSATRLLWPALPRVVGVFHCDESSVLSIVWRSSLEGWVSGHLPARVLRRGWWQRQRCVCGDGFGLCGHTRITRWGVCQSPSGTRHVGLVLGVLPVLLWDPRWWGPGPMRGALWWCRGPVGSPSCVAVSCHDGVFPRCLTFLHKSSAGPWATASQSFLYELPYGPIRDLSRLCEPAVAACAAEPRAPPQGVRGSSGARRWPWMPHGVSMVLRRPRVVRLQVCVWLWSSAPEAWLYIFVVACHPFHAVHLSLSLPCPGSRFLPSVIFRSVSACPVFGPPLPGALRPLPEVSRVPMCGVSGVSRLACACARPCPVGPSRLAVVRSTSALRPPHHVSGVGNRVPGPSSCSGGCEEGILSPLTSRLWSGVRAVQIT